MSQFDHLNSLGLALLELLNYMLIDGMDHYSQDQASRIYSNIAFAPITFLKAMIAVGYYVLSQHVNELTNQLLVDIATHLA